MWTPERHFHTFGGRLRNPSAIGAACSWEPNDLVIALLRSASIDVNSLATELVDPTLEASFEKRFHVDSPLRAGLPRAPRVLRLAFPHPRGQNRSFPPFLCSAVEITGRSGGR